MEKTSTSEDYRPAREQRVIGIDEIVDNFELSRVGNALWQPREQARSTDQKGSVGRSTHLPSCFTTALDGTVHYTVNEGEHQRLHVACQVDLNRYDVAVIVSERE